MLGGSAKGDLFSAASETGELTEVASAKRAVRGNLEEVVEELEPVLVDLAAIEGAFFSEEFAKPAACGARLPPTMSTGETGSND